MGEWTFESPNPITSYVVAVEFARPLSAASLQSISNLHHNFKRELPRRVEQQALVFQMGAPMPFAPPGVVAGAHPEFAGVVFDHLLSDGATLSALTVNKTVAQYMTSRYTRWDEYWPVAERLMAAVGSVALTETPITVLHLVASNRFRTSDPIAPKKLLRKSEYVAAHILQCNGPCHCAHGYQAVNQEPPGERTDNVILSIGRQGDGSAFAEVNFSLRLSLAVPITTHEQLIGRGSPTERSEIGIAFLGLHRLNNDMLRSIVSPSVVDSIDGLGRS